MPRDEPLYLTDIIDFAEGISRMIGGRSRIELVTDEVSRRVAPQALIEIGEAAARLSGPFRARHPDVEWTDSIAFRNIAVHASFAGDREIVWITAIRNAPELSRLIKAILQREYPPPPPSDAPGS